MKITLEDMRTAVAMCKYASINWKACFCREEIRQYSKDILLDRDVLKTYLSNLAEDIDTDRLTYHIYNDEAIDLYNKGNEILKRMTA